MIDITPFLMTYQYGHHKGGHGKHPNPTPIPGHPGHPGNPCHPIPGGGHHCGPDIHWHTLVAGKPAHIALWVYFGLFAAGFVGTFLVARRVQNKIRIFHYLSALSLAITATSYFVLCTGLGTAGPGRHHHSMGHGHMPHHHHRHHHDGKPPIGIPENPAPIDIYVREIFWAQDAAHIFTLPMYVAQLAILSGMSPIHALTAIFASAFSGFCTVAADHFSSHRRGFHPRLPFIGWTVLGLLWTLGAWCILFFPGITAARTRKRSTQGLYALGILMLVLGWFVYPIIWFLGTGVNILGVNAQVIVQGLIDISTQLGLTFFILFTHVHDPEDPVWSFPDWFVHTRTGTGPDGRGSYAAVAAGDHGESS